MQALEELPNRDKDLVMPLVPIGPWVGAHHLSSSLSRLEQAYGDRPCFVTLAELEPNSTERPVHQQITSLGDPTGGYRNWCSFVESHSNFVPTIQLGQLRELRPQCAVLNAFGRGIMVPIEYLIFEAAERLSIEIGSLTNGGEDVLFLLDLGRVDRDILNWEMRINGLIQVILKNASNSMISVSASSFPESFSSINSQEIFERSLFHRIVSSSRGKLIYSDRGSARAERQTGGGGAPAPRIDYALKDQWTFFRSDNGEGPTAYFEQAKAAIKSAQWDPKIRIWGTQMIERTALGDYSAIVSPKRSTAARINIHLHRQLFYDDPTQIYDTDDEWSD
jgi:hypothetical protein